jgi:hypothetical protein
VEGDTELVGDTAVASQARAKHPLSRSDAVKGDGGLANTLNVQIATAHSQVPGGNDDVEFGVVLALK